ncbi:MAG: hypothetical protein IJQ81_14400 [Oscillibacter sp.]|nr:hypothetical protein [Oscillibacter sp.]
MADDSKNKVIATQNLTIRGHLLKWSDTSIQISNISMVSTASLPAPRFPVWSVIIFAIGLLVTVRFAEALSYSYYDTPTIVIITVGVILISVGAVGFAAWMSSVQDSAEQKYLHIFLNSGNVYSFIVRDQKFLQQMLQVFSNIFESGTTNETNFQINVQGCEIRENGAVVNLNVR